MNTILGVKIEPLPTYLANRMDNWLTISEAIYDQKVQKDVVLQMLSYEYTHNGRKYVLHRLKSRYVTLAMEELKIQLNKEVPNGI